MIWKQPATLEGLNSIAGVNLPRFLEIEFIEIGSDFLKAKMPVIDKTKQPMGLLHGGASVALAETLGSVASILCIPDISKKTAVGLEINANHLSSVRDGHVIGTVTPIKIGRNIHVWEINIVDQNEKPICRSRLTTAIIDHK